MPESLMGTHCTTSVIIQVKAEPYLNNFAGRCQCYNLLGNGLMASDLVTAAIMTPPRAHTVTLCLHETVLASVSSELCQVSPLRALSSPLPAFVWHSVTPRPGSQALWWSHHAITSHKLCKAAGNKMEMSRELSWVEPIWLEKAKSKVRPFEMS